MQRRWRIIELYWSWEVIDSVEIKKYLDDIPDLLFEEGFLEELKKL